MLDDKFTQAIQSWLNAKQELRSLSEGAELLLRLNRNKWMYQQILRTSNFSKLEYELKKHLQIRLDGLTLQEVAEMERRVLPIAQKSIENNAPVISTDAENPSPQFAGKRADHDTLPDDIKELYDRNGETYFKLKQTFETLKQMQDAQPCDRYEYLKVLSELDKQYRENWQRYDSYQLNSEHSEHSDNSDHSEKPAPKKSTRKKKTTHAPTS